MIKRVGGLDELEKQLEMRLNLNQNSAIVGTNGKTTTTTTTTTISPISQSLYNKVLGTKRGTLREQKVISSTQSNADVEPLVQRQIKESRYSAVNRNSRPAPQNDGLDQLSEIEGGEIIRERPKYTTITRTHAPKSQQAEEAEEEEELEQTVTVATSDEESDEMDDAPQNPTTRQPIHQYVNIQRVRPSTTAAPALEEQEQEKEIQDDDDEEEDEDEEIPAKVVPTTTPRMQYVNIQRVRPTKPQYIQDEVESESPVTETK